MVSFEHTKLGIEKEGRNVYYTTKVSAGHVVFPIKKVHGDKWVTVGETSVDKVNIIHMRDELRVEYHCDNGEIYTETLDEQGLIHRDSADARGEVIRRNRNGNESNA